MTLLLVKNWLEGGKRTDTLEQFIQQQRHSLEVKVQAELVSLDEEALEEQVIVILESYLMTLKKERIQEGEPAMERVRTLFGQETDKRKRVIQRVQNALAQSFQFLSDTFGDGQEMVLFVTGLSRNREGMDFITKHGCPAYFTYSKKLLFQEREKELQREIETLQNQWQE